MDLYSRKIVGYSFSKSLSAEITLEAIKDGSDSKKTLSGTDISF